MSRHPRNLPVGPRTHGAGTLAAAVGALLLGLLTATPAAATTTGGTDFSVAPQVTHAITVGQTPVLVTVPGAPALSVIQVGDGAVTATFTAPASTGGGAVTSYTVSASGGGHTTTATGTGSPITVSGLSNGTAYTFTVAATNSAGSGPASKSITATPAAAVRLRTYSLDVTTTPPAGNASAFGPGSLAATVGATGFIYGALALPDITFSDYRLFGVLPTSVHARVVPADAVTGTITNNTLTVTTSVALRIDQLSVLGVPLLTPGSTCQAVTPATVTLSGSADVLQNGGTLTGGSYTAANFTGCGLLGFFLEPLLNTIVSGVPNTITATFGKPTP